VTLEKPDLYVIARFLGTLYANGSPMNKTAIQTRIGLNYPRFIEYLDWMEAHGLIVRIATSDGSEAVDLSSRGLDLYVRLFEWIRDAMQGPK
jgi:predicted transcriptional regulator